MLNAEAALYGGGAQDDDLIDQGLYLGIAIAVKGLSVQHPLQGTCTD